MEKELKAFLLRSIEAPQNFIRYFPLNSEDNFKDQLLIISNRIKNYGNGYLQNKDLVYYYRTFTLQESNITIFCIIYFHFSLKRKYLENLADEIYSISETYNLFENNHINENTILRINELYLKYISIIKKDKSAIGFCSGIELIRNNTEDGNNINIDYNSTKGIVQKSKRYSRIKSKTNCDLENTFTNTPLIETELTYIMRGYNLNKILIIRKWKKFKNCWFIIFIIIGVLIYGLLGFYIYLWMQ